MSIFNINAEDESARMDRSLCNIIDEINQVKDRLRKTKQKRNEEMRECKMLKKELASFSSWTENQSCMISSLKRDKTKLMHKIHDARTYIMVLKHMLSSSELRRDDLTKEFNSKNIVYRNKCSKWKSKKLSLENKIQRIKDIELKRHHLKNTMKTRQAKRDDRLAKTRAGLIRLEQAKEQKSSNGGCGSGAVTETLSEEPTTTVESKWQELIAPYNNNATEFLSIFESKRQELALREKRLQALQESSSNCESSTTPGSRTMPLSENSNKNNKSEGSDDCDDIKVGNVENAAAAGEGIEEVKEEKEKAIANAEENIVQLLCRSFPSIEWKSIQSSILSVTRDQSIVELKIKL